MSIAPAIFPRTLGTLLRPRPRLRLRPGLVAPRPPARTMSSNNSTATASTSSTALLYDGRVFGSAANTANGEVGADTRFHYHQDGKVVWAEYAGGSIVRGFLIATVQADDSLDMRYEHVNREGELMTGRCLSTPEKLADGRLRMHEKWQWTSGDLSAGESTLEEVRAD